MRRHFVSGFPRALLSLGQEKSSGVEIASYLWAVPKYAQALWGSILVTIGSYKLFQSSQIAQTSRKSAIRGRPGSEPARG